MSVISIEQDEEYNTLIEKLEGFISDAEKKIQGKEAEIDKQLAMAEYSLLKTFGNGKFNKERSLKTRLQNL